MIPKIIHQFWDRLEPPADVAERMRTWPEKQPDWAYIQWNDASAEEFIGAHFGVAAKRRFHSARSPAMRSDILRLAAILVIGGVYIDADMACVRPVNILRKGASCTIYHRTKEHLPWILYNAFIIAEPQHPVLRVIWEEMTATVDKGESRDVQLLTGPGLWGRVWHETLTAEQRATVRVITKKKMFGFIGRGAGLSYKTKKELSTARAADADDDEDTAADARDESAA